MAGKTGKYEPTEYGVRLKAAMKLAGLVDASGEVKPGAMAKIGAALGISGAAVGMVLSGQTKQFNPANSAKAARWLKVDHYWLATGEGDARPSGLSQQAKEFAARFDKLNEAEQKRWILLMTVARDGVPDKLVEQLMPITKEFQQEQES